MKATTTEILSTRIFARLFRSSLGRSPIQVRWVSPYIGKVPGFGGVVALARAVLRYEEAHLQIITQPPGTGSDRVTVLEADLLVKLNVDLLVRPRPYLHSKVYHFGFREGDAVSFIGSANLTKGGFERNDETVAMVTGRENNERVTRELNRLAGKGTLSYFAWKARSRQQPREE